MGQICCICYETIPNGIPETKYIHRRCLQSCIIVPDNDTIDESKSDNLILPQQYKYSIFDAIIEGNLKRVKHFLSYKTNINPLTNNGESALIMASWKGHKEIVEFLLINGANVNHSNNFGGTALIYASRWGHIQIVEILLEYGANINQINNEGESALMHATWMNHIDITKLLIYNGANITLKNKHDLSMLNIFPI
jgi:ankyrin repeat protein